MTTDLKRILAKNLTEARKKANKTQEQTADEAGIPRSTYGSYEEGRAEPGLSILQKLSIVLNRTVDELLTPLDIIAMQGDKREI